MDTERTAEAGIPHDVPELTLDEWRSRLGRAEAALVREVEVDGTWRPAAFVDPGLECLNPIGTTDYVWRGSERIGPTTRGAGYALPTPLPEDGRKADPPPFGDVNAALARFRERLPGWWFTLGSCHVSNDATVAPMTEGPDARLLVHRLFDEGFSVDLRDGTVCDALDMVVEEALAARANPPVDTGEFAVPRPSTRDVHFTYPGPDGATVSRGVRSTGFRFGALDGFPGEGPVLLGLDLETRQPVEVWTAAMGPQTHLGEHRVTSPTPPDVARRRTPGDWRCRSATRDGMEGYALEAELPCDNGLRAWFEVGFVHGRDARATAASEGALADAKDDAEAIVAAVNA